MFSRAELAELKEGEEIKLNFVARVSWVTFDRRPVISVDSHELKNQKLMREFKTLNHSKNLILPS